MTQTLAYRTGAGFRVTRTEQPLDPATALDRTLVRLDHRRGAVLTSSYDYPGRYTRWSLGFVDPPLELSTKGDAFAFTALNDRGQVLLEALEPAVRALPVAVDIDRAADRLTGRVARGDGVFDEAERTRQPSVFSVIRAVVAAFASTEDSHFGLYGAFGYDLVYQLEPIATLRPRPDDHRDLVAFVPDELIVIDHQRDSATRYRYEVTAGNRSTAGLPRDGVDTQAARLAPVPPSDFPDGGYASEVAATLPAFHAGDLFEVVPGQSFYHRTQAAPSAIFGILKAINPSPYGFIFNLGGEHLIGASPEMYVRVEGDRVETCPISGTIRRGADALEDAERIRTLLNSAKDEAELTMCTDVDRNDKARVCRPGTVRVIGRRQIEMYSHLIHTVDHVEGRLRPDRDALDAFLTHCWAVTVTGAPKRAAIEHLEARERGFRRWYGGAVGRIGFDGGMNTGLTLRALRLKDGVAEIRVGATLLSDSIPEEEERETRLKAAALLRTLELADQPPQPAAPAPVAAEPRPERRVLLVDCEDSFVHTLASYVAAEGAAVTILRHGAAPAALDRDWDLVLLSPGPGRPDRFGLPALIQAALARRLPLFGVCLGLQAMVEAFGGILGVMPEPRHGKPSTITVKHAGRLFGGLPERFTVGRYHSLHAARMPAALIATAYSDDGVVMAAEHPALPVAGVQFHPESIMSLGGGAGARILRNALDNLRPQGYATAAA